MRTYAVDTETYWDRDYSVATLGPGAYVRDPRFECHLLTIAGDDGYEYVGPPEKADWERLRGQRWVEHNAAFDEDVILRMMETGQVPRVEPGEVHCTADMSVYFGYPRALKNVVHRLFGETRNKAIRDKETKGVRWRDMGVDLRRRFMEYAITDARDTLRLWQALSPKWPDWEKRLSALNRGIGRAGLPTDGPALNEAIALMKRVRWEAACRIPWAETDSEGDEGVLSRKKFFAACDQAGIPRPKSMAKDSEEFNEWLARFGALVPWVRSISDFRRANTFLSKFEGIRLRLKPDGNMSFGLLYFGASTGRFSGTGGVNTQNLAKYPIGVTEDWHIAKGDEPVHRSADMRALFRAPKGEQLAIADFSQIEARVLLWLAGDSDSLKAISKGYGVYEAHARQSMGWTGGSLKKENPKLYALAKARVLGLGYGCGWRKFITFGKAALGDDFASVFGAPVSADQIAEFWGYVDATSQREPARSSALREEWQKLDNLTRRAWVNSWLQVTDFRRSNPKITALWRDMDHQLKAALGDDFHVELPSGRRLPYFGVCRDEGQYFAATTLGEKPSHLYGGLLVENLCQAVARDILGFALLNLHDAGFRIILHVHDEIVARIRHADEAGRMREIMLRRPPWASRLPLDAGIEVSDRYTK